MEGSIEGVSQELLDILICPETHQALKVADAVTLGRMNALANAGKLKNRSGKPVTGPLQGALVREDGELAYAVTDSIPIMLIEEAIPMAQVRNSP